MCPLLLYLLGERVRSSNTYFRNEVASPPLTRRSPGDAGTNTRIAENAGGNVLKKAEQHVAGKARVKYPIRNASLPDNIYSKPVHSACNGTATKEMPRTNYCELRSGVTLKAASHENTHLSSASKEKSQRREDNGRLLTSILLPTLLHAHKILCSSLFALCELFKLWSAEIMVIIKQTC